MKQSQPSRDKQVEQALAMRQYAIGLALSTERLLETLGYPVESAIVTRRERRRLTRQNK